MGLRLCVVVFFIPRKLAIFLLSLFLVFEVICGGCLTTARFELGGSESPFVGLVMVSWNVLNARASEWWSAIFAYV